MTAAVLLLLPLSFLLSWTFTLAMKQIALRIGFVDKPGGRKIHDKPRALGGGVAIFWAIAVPLIAGLAYVNIAAPPLPRLFLMKGAHLHDSYVSVGSTRVSADRLMDLKLSLTRHWDGIRSQTPTAVKVLLAMLAMHLLGLYDDRQALGPYIKLLVQLGIVTALVLSADIRILTALDRVWMGKALSVILSVLWIAAITNAFNFLDNMDGLSAGVGAVCSAAFLVTTLTMAQPQWFVGAMLALLIGALLGFLCFNFNPASIFMGDSGSLLVGLLLGVLTVRTTYLTRPLAQGWYEIFAPVIVLAVPVYDMVVVSAIRIGRGKSPFVGDKNHLSHRLEARGMSRRTAVLCIYLITAATSAAAIILAHAQTALAAGVVFVQTLLILGVVMLLERHPLPADDASRGEKP
jgi:UDP-GlcNAc:undecaprenyl-phosphate GlcNAc-1-phosphate transferase